MLDYQTLVQNSIRPRPAGYDIDSEGRYALETDPLQDVRDQLAASAAQIQVNTFTAQAWYESDCAWTRIDWMIESIARNTAKLDRLTRILEDVRTSPGPAVTEDQALADLRSLHAALVSAPLVRFDHDRRYQARRAQYERAQIRFALMIDPDYGRA